MKFRIILLFLLVAAIVLSGLIFNGQLMGRSLDFPVPPVSFLAKNVFVMNFYQWWDTFNGGNRNTFAPALIPVNSILYLPVLFNASSWFVSRYQIILTLFLAMLFFYILARRLLGKYDIKEEHKETISILGAIFFALNNYFFCEIIFGSNVMYLTFAFVPLLAYSLISYEKTKKYSYFFLLMLALLVVSSTLQHFVLAYVIIVAIILVIYRDYKTFIKLGALHLFLSLYWMIPMMFTAGEIRGAEMANDPTASLTISAQSFLNALINKEYVFNRDHYMSALANNYLAYIWIFNAFILLGVSLFCVSVVKSFKKEYQKFIFSFVVIFLGSVLFMKGGHEPFGNFVIYLYKNFSVFNLFRSVQHYIGFYVIAISILFVFSSAYIVKRKQFFIYIIAVLVLINALPWWATRDLGITNITKSNKIPSYFGQFYLTEGNWKMYSLNNLKLDFALLPMPPGFSISYLAVGKNENNYINSGNLKIKTQGGDAGLAYSNKGFYATEVGKSVLSETLNNLEKEMYVDKNFFNDNKNLFSLLNIKYFVLREDAAPLFSKNASLFDVGNIKEAISNSKIFQSVSTTDYITILENKNFLPHFYTPQNNIVSLGDSKNIANMISGDDYQIRSAIYCKDQNIGKEDILKQVRNSKNKQENELPVTEFKKINPTKYRVMIHGASGQFPLVFSESFHDGWKSYLVKPKQDTRYKIQDTNLEQYKILDGNSEDQASVEELREYVEKGWVTSLGNDQKKEIKHQKWEDNREKLDYVEKYNVDFVSKNFQGTIQNDNLPISHFWETWFQKPIENNANHLMANGYANSWVIDADKLCSENPVSCRKNPDGTYDIETVVEFWPQRLFYIGLGISGLTLLSCLGYLGYDFAKRRKKKDITIKEGDAKED